MRKTIILNLLTIGVLFGSASAYAEPQAVGIERAQGERLSNAVGHYAKSKSLLVAAINEFDKGYKLATPDAVIDGREWRSQLLDRAEELNRVLDPQPRTTKGGITFEGDSRLINEAIK